METEISVYWFYSVFDDYSLQPQYIALAVSAFIITVLIKAFIFKLSQYKRFDGSLLVAGINTLLSGLGLFSIFFFGFWFTEDMLLFVSGIFGAIYVLELLFTLLLKGKNSFVDGLIGSLLGNTFLFMAIMLGVTLYFFPLV